jgi:hypothetical protein
MIRETSALLLTCLTLWAPGAFAAPAKVDVSIDVRLDAGLAVVANRETPLPDGRRQSDYRLLGAASLRRPDVALYGSMSCSGVMTRGPDGTTLDDHADCLWTTAEGDHVAWRYQAEPGNAGQGFQHAVLRAMSGSGRWADVSGALSTDVMFKPKAPDALALFLVGAGALNTAGAATDRARAPKATTTQERVR